MKPTTTMTTPYLVEIGSTVTLSAGRRHERLMVRGITGAGPYTLTLSPPTRWERAWGWLAGLIVPARRRFLGWRYSRCCARFCWRREAVVDVEWDGWCRRHSDGKVIRHEA